MKLQNEFGGLVRFFKPLAGADDGVVVLFGSSATMFELELRSNSFRIVSVVHCEDGWLCARKRRPAGNADLLLPFGRKR